MKIVININCENDAFKGINDTFKDNTEQEIARILKNISNKLDNGLSVKDMNMNLRDYNGNTCGTIEIIK